MGGAVFVASLLFFSWWFFVLLGRASPMKGWAPVAADLVLFSVFAGHHSVCARDPVKRWIAAQVPAPLVRSVYVWIASLLFIAVMAFWQPIGGEIFAAHGLRAAAHVAVQLFGVWTISRAVAAIDPLELAGIRPAADAAAGLQVTGVYRWVRHPLYLGWVMATLGAGHMTGDRLVFSLVAALYLAVAVPWEERSLVRDFGDAYAAYRRRVRWRMIPFIY
jgi:protein-S-isoprenylcysteine O-methyltransferase Ste14